MTDKRRALGTSNGGDEYSANRLPGQWENPKPETAIEGGGNPAIASNRPIANMIADVGSNGCVKKGVAFCYPMGDD